jgi:hypothetical protein
MTAEETIFMKICREISRTTITDFFIILLLKLAKKQEKRMYYLYTSKMAQ